MILEFVMLNGIIQKMKQTIFSNKVKFITYNLLLPLVLPLLILIGINTLQRESRLDLLNIIFQSISLFTVVNLFTNIGLWSSDKIYNFSDSAKNKETHIAISLVFGLISVFLFVSSIIIDSTSAYLLPYLAISISMLIFSITLYYLNPLIMHSGPDVDQASRNTKTNQLIEDITGE